MSWLNLKQIILGLAGTTAQKFTLQTPDVPDGTAKLSRGVPGALGQDILLIDALGRLLAGVAPVAGVRTGQLATMKMFADEYPGGTQWQTLPGGLIMQWGSASVPANNSPVQVPLPVSFPTSGLVVVATIAGSGFSNAVIGAVFANAGAVNLYNASSGGAQTAQFIAFGR